MSRLNQGHYTYFRLKQDLPGYLFLRVSLIRACKYARQKHCCLLRASLNEEYFASVLNPEINSGVNNAEIDVVS